MKVKAFARAVNRDDIPSAADGLGLPLENLIAGVITLREDAARLRVAG